MILKSIRLTNFRSFREKEFKFSGGTTLVVGPNTSGKTNLLEAIYLLATGKSFRAKVEAEMIKYGEELARVSGVILDGRSATPVPRRVRGVALRTQNPTENTELEIVLTTGQVIGKRVAKKRYVVNGVGKRMVDFVGNLRCVVFRPEDLEIILSSPSVRRDYLDSVLESVDREYRRASLSYQKGLRQRNKILESYREAKFPSFRERLKRQLYFWDSLLIKNGEVITQKREEFIEFINQQPEYFGKLKVDYDKSIISPQRLAQYTQQEVAAGMTLVGPHRDDIKLKIQNSKLKMGEEKDLHIFGSRGEQRTAVLSLKLAELEYVSEKTVSRPVLLLDDIFSELDQAHRARIFEVIPKQQTIITTTDLRLAAKEYRKEIEIVSLHSGRGPFDFAQAFGSEVFDSEAQTRGAQARRGKLPTPGVS